MDADQIVTSGMKVMETTDYGSDAFELAAWAVYGALSSGHRETLRQLFNHGPVWDGDICSKAARGDLFRWGLATRVCHKGEQGYTAATYPAYTILSRAEPKPRGLPSAVDAAQQKRHDPNLNHPGAQRAN